MRKKQIITALMVLCMAFGLPGCKQNVGTPEDNAVVEEAEDDADEAEKNRLFGFSCPDLSDPFYEVLKESVAVSLDGQGDRIMVRDAQCDPETQTAQIQEMIDAGASAVFLIPSDPEGILPALESLKEAGIPVILMDREAEIADESLYVTRVGSDFRAEGENAGLWLAEHLEQQGRADEEINIVVLTGTEGATSTIGRTEGFEEIARQHSNWNILEQTGADYTTSKAKEEMRSILEEHDDIDVLVSQNDDMTFGALDVFKEAGITTGVDGDVTVISFDAVRTALELVRSGEINVDIECNPEQGPYIENVIRMLENGENIDKNYYVPEKIFTQENVGMYINDRSY